MYKGQTALTSRLIWSVDQNVAYTFSPDSFSYTSGDGTLTIIKAHHGLVTGDTINLTYVLDDSDADLNDTGLAITVVDSSTFQVTLSTGLTMPSMTSVENLNAIGAIGETSVFRISVPDYSEVAFTPSMIQVNTLDAGDSVTIQAKIHIDANWVDITTLTNADGNKIYILDATGANRFNFVRVKQAGGVSHSDVYAQ